MVIFGVALRNRSLVANQRHMRHKWRSEYLRILTLTNIPRFYFVNKHGLLFKTITVNQQILLILAIILIKEKRRGRLPL